MSCRLDYSMIVITTFASYFINMRYISADYIFPISSEPIKNGVIAVDEDGTIIEVISDSKFQISNSEVDYYKGIICPGFVNAHCHLELSFMKDKIAEHIGMTGFIKDILKKRNDYSSDEIDSAIVSAEAEMIKNGIVAVGDICNNDSTFKQKAKKNLQYHSFIEVFNLNPDVAEDTFNKGKELVKELNELNCSIVPHAPYTMSEELLVLINNYSKENKSIITIHNQESVEESELFESQSGLMFETFTILGFNINLFRHTKKNSLASTLPYLMDARKILLVHNTYTSENDFEFIKSQISNDKTEIYFCTCPNANIYIENKLPNYNLFIEQDALMTVGTDSLASNHSLSILDELKTITKHFPEIALQTLLTWATKNGAEFFDFKSLGTIEKGKRPGLNLLNNIEGMRINKETTVAPLL